MSRSSHAVAVACLLLVLSVYVALVFLVSPLRVFFSGDAGMKFIQVQSLIRGGWRVGGIEYPGRALDPELRFFPTSGFAFVLGGQVYLQYPLVFAALSSVPYALLGYRGLYLIPLLSTVLTAVIVYRWTYRHAPRWAGASILLFGLGTPVLFYSLVFWEHTPAVLLTSLGVYLLSQSAGDLVAGKAGVTISPNALCSITT